MKRKLRNILALSLVLTIGILACSKDFDPIVIDVYDYSFTEAHVESGFIYEGTPTTFSLKPEREISTVGYFFRYEILEGEGFYQDLEGKKIVEGEPMDIAKRQWECTYIPTRVGTHRVKVTTNDSNGQAKEMELSYKVDHAPFSLLFNKGSELAIINSQNPVVLSLLREKATSAGENSDFTVTYTVKDGTGTLFHGETPLEPGKGHTLAKGTAELGYVPTTLGEHTLALTATAPDGAIRTAELKIEVGHLDFSITTTAEANQVKLGTELPINIGLKNQDPESGVAYEMALSYGTEGKGSGILADPDGKQVKAGEFKGIVPGQHKYSFLSNDLGPKKLYFDLRDSNGQVKRDSVTVNVSNVPFTFTGNTESNNVLINQPARFNFTLSADGNTENIGYSYSYEVQKGNGELHGPNGKPLQNNTPQEVALGAFSLDYLPKSLGAHTIVFSVTDSYGQESAAVTINLQSGNADLDFDASAARNEMIVKQSNAISLNLVEDNAPDGIIYEMTHFITGGTASLYQNSVVVPQSQFLEVRPGGWQYDFVPELPGNYTLTFRLRDSNGQLIERKVVIAVLQTDFLFSASFASSTTPLGTSNRLNFNISPSTTNNGTTYVMSYTSNLNGTMELSGTEYLPGQQMAVQEGQYSAVFVPAEVGELQLVFTVRDSNGVEKNSTAPMTVINGDYTFNVATAPQEIYVSESSEFNFDLKQVVDNPSATYEISYAIKGGSGDVMGVDGSKVQPGVFVPIPTGASKWTFGPRSVGAVVFDFTVRDNTGTIKERSATLNVRQKDFQLNAIPSKTSEFVNVAVPISVSIDELAEDSGDTYELYVSSNRNGSVRYKGDTYSVGEHFAVQPGDFFIDYIGTQAGQHNLGVSVKSSSNVIRSKDVDLTFQQVDYAFSGASSKPEISVGDSTPLNFNITENAGSSTYKIRYVATGTGAAIRDQNGDILAPGTLHDVPKGNFSWSLEGTQAGTVDLSFVSRNATGLEKSVDIEVNVAPKDYNFTAFGAASSAFVGESVDINMEISEIGTGGDTYTMLYSTDNTGSLKLNGAVYAPGQSFSVPVGASTLSYTGSNKGSHKLSFTVTSSSNVKKTKEVTIGFEQMDFSLSGGSQFSEITIGAQTKLNFNISETAGTSSYTMRHTVNGNALITDQNGNQVSSGNVYSVPKGNFSWNLTGISEGSIDMDFYVKNDTGTEKRVDITVNVVPKEFNFTANAAAANAFTGDPVDIGFNLTEIGVGGDTYTMYYTSGSNVGSLRYKGTTYVPGETFNVPVGQFNGSYTGTSEGTHGLQFHVRSSSNVERTGSTSIRYEKYEEPFSLTIGQPSGNKFKGVPFDLSIVTRATEGHDPSTTYGLVFSYGGNPSAGTLAYKGVVFGEGQTIPLDYGARSLRFTPTTEEDFSISFTATNSTGKSDDEIENIDIYRLVSVKTKGEKHNVSCGGTNGCDYEVRVYVCWPGNCTEAFEGSENSQAQIRVFNRRSNKWDTLLFEWSDLREANGDFFRLEIEERESRLRYLDQDYYIKIKDSNGIWSDEEGPLQIKRV